MTPLQRIAMGLVIVVLDTQTPWDLLPDVLGWLLVLAGVADLPDLAFAFLLARSLGRAAAEVGDRRTAGRMRVLLTVVTVLAIAPVLVFAAGAEHLLPAATLLVQVMWICLVWNLFAAHARPYAVDHAGTGS